MQAELTIAFVVNVYKAETILNLKYFSPIL